MKKTFILLIAVFFIILFSKANAAPTNKGPVCAVEGKVLNIILDNGKTINGLGIVPVHYYAKLRIEKSQLNQPEGVMGCAGFAITDQNVIIMPKEYKKNPVKKNDRISSDLQFKGDEKLNGYFLSSIKKLAQEKSCNIQCLRYDPVCGENQKTFSCGLAEANCLNIKVLYKGECKKQNGTITGHLNIGPICPVERIGHPCLPVPEVFKGRKVSVYSKDKNTLLQSVNFDGKGNYKISINPGSYFLAIDNTGIQKGKIWKMADVKSGMTIKVDFDIDTGIR